jgi:mannose-1-phosphate guanylyltransferase/mannose-6-phosphate isomerase
MSMIVPVILCGGSGTRLWPKSRPERPKPFIPLVGGRSLFAQTLSRFPAEEGFAAPLLVTGANLRVLVEEALEGRQAALIVEPAQRNTAPAIALAAHRLPEDAIMLICPSDHHIGDTDAFRAASTAAVRLAAQGHLVAIGIAPTRAETGYGYIRRGEPLDGGFAVERFVEKPDPATAKAYLADGSYVWNAGIFAFTAGGFLSELARYRPEMAAVVVEAVAKGSEADGAFMPNAESFIRVPSESVDYAVMENTSRAAVVLAEMTWSDIGSWHAVQAARGGDAAGNCPGERGELVDCRNVMVESDGPRVSVVGLEDVIVVVDGGEVLVTSAAGAQKVGALNGAKSE